jgi:hypothetical protein
MTMVRIELSSFDDVRAVRKRVGDLARCRQRPDWRTRKPVAVDGFRTGGYGLEIARALARTVNCRWRNGHLVVRAEFD